MIHASLRNKIKVGQGQGDKEGGVEDGWQLALPNRLVKVDTVVKVNWNRLAHSGVGHADIWEEHSTGGKASAKACAYMFSEQIRCQCGCSRVPGG